MYFIKNNTIDSLHVSVNFFYKKTSISQNLKKKSVTVVAVL